MIPSYACSRALSSILFNRLVVSNSSAIFSNEVISLSTIIAPEASSDLLMGIKEAITVKSLIEIRLASWLMPVLIVLITHSFKIGKTTSTEVPVSSSSWSLLNSIAFKLTVVII